MKKLVISQEEMIQLPKQSSTISFRDLFKDEFRKAGFDLNKEFTYYHDPTNNSYYFTQEEEKE